MPAAPIASSRLARLGDAALLPAAYAAAATWLVVLLADLPAPPRRLAAALGIAFLATLAIYLLDRVKWRDAWLDPADPEAHPHRHALLWPHRKATRAGAAAALLMATGLAGTLRDPEALGGWWLATLPAAGALGAWLYAGRPRRGAPRPKDLLPLKHVAVATAITALATVLALGAAGRARTPAMAVSHLLEPTLLAVAAALALRIAADAVWCDLDDAAADRRFGTASLPARFGGTAAWIVGLLLVLAAGGIAAVGASSPRGAIWAIAGLVGGGLLAWRRPARVRDLAELRLPLEATLLSLVASGGVA